MNITYGSAVPKLGQVEEIKQTDSQSLVPWKENYSYDSLSRVTSKTVSFDNQAYAYTTGYGYNQAGQLTQMTYPSNRVVKYGFDSRGRLNALGDSTLATKYISGMSYQPSQQVGSITLNNGVTESYGYSADRLQLTSQTATKSSNTLMSLTYNYVAPKSRSGGTGSTNVNTGQLMDITNSQIKDPSGVAQQRNESYNYDQVARLKQASGFYPQLNYSYDRFGNRTGVSGGTSQTVTLQQSGGVTNNRIATVNGITYGYDAAGDVTNDGLYAYAFDAECRIVSVDSGSTGTYSYDAANRRVKKAVVIGGISYTTYYVWEGSKVIAEYGNAPAGGGGMRFYHPDRLSNRMITDASGAVKGTMDNLPFGEDGGVAEESEKHRFTSYERDSETGSDYAMNRQHHYATGRFMRPDPVLGSVFDPQSLHRYSYTANEPINRFDPLGLLKCYLDGVETDCGFVLRIIDGGNFQSISYTENGVTRTIDRNNFYSPIAPSTDPNIVHIGTTFNSTAFDAAVKALIGLLPTSSATTSGFGSGDFGGAGAGDRWDGDPSLFRGERPTLSPDVACKEGIKPKGSGTDLRQAVTTSSYRGNFTMTSRSRSVAAGFVQNNGFVYLINSSRGIDVNRALGSSSPYPEQQIVAIPGGVLPHEITGAFVVRGGRLTSEFLPCKK